MKIESCSAASERTTKRGDRQPAVGVGNTIAQTHARLFCRPPTVYVRIAVAFTVIVTTEGLRPPLLYCDADVRRHKKRFLRCTNARSQERQALARRGSSDAPATASVFVRTGRSRHTRTAGLRQPLRVACTGAVAGVRFRPAGALRLARLAYASRSWCTTWVR